MNTPPTQTLTIAVLGSGSAGMRHLSAARAIPGLRPLAIPVRPERAEKLKSEGWEVSRSLAGSGARLAVVATDTARHERDTLAALAAGCDVLVEKPLAPDLTSGRRIAEAAAKTRRKVFVGCVLRHSLSLGLFREWLPELGPVHRVCVQAQSYLPDWRPGRPYKDSYSARSAEGGVLRDLIHEIDYTCWLFGQPKSVSADLKNLGRLGIESEELADLRWTSPSGAAVSVHLDYLTRTPVRRMTAWGAEGKLEWDGIAGRATLSPRAGSERSQAPVQSRDDLARAQLEAFAAASAGNPSDKLATLGAGLAALWVCDAARRSSASKHEEPLS